MKDKHQGKMNRHFTILCDGHNVKVLKCKQPCDRKLEIITIIRSEFLNGYTKVITINDDKQHIFEVRNICMGSFVSYYSFTFEIIREEHRDIEK